MTRFASLAVVTALVSTLAGPVRAAGDALEQARALFQAGAQAYEKADYAGALEAFEAAYRVSQRPGILFSIAQAHRRQYHVDGTRAHLLAAMRHYRQYLDQVSEGGRRADAVRALAELEVLAARLPEEAEPSTPAETPAPRSTRLIVSAEAPGARIAVDGGALHDSPYVATVSPGAHRIRVVAPGYEEAERNVVAIEGEMMGFDVSPRELPARIDVSGGAGMEIAVDGRSVGRTPLAAPAEVPAGRHLLTVTERGHRPRQFDIEVSRGERRTLPVRLEPTGQRVLSYVLFSAAGAGLVAGGVATTLALVHQGDAQSIDAARRRENVSAGDLREYGAARASRDDYRTGAWVCFGAAAVMATGGAALFLFDRQEPDRTIEADRPSRRVPRSKSLEVSVDPDLSHRAVGAALRGVF